MNQNKYDDPVFFSEYMKMSRSSEGLDGAGEWPIFKRMLPELKGTDVLDLGCGLGWHCRYVREQQARSVIGVDLSEKMLAVAREKTTDQQIQYLNMPIEMISFSIEQFDLVLSSLAFHYLEAVDLIFKKVYDYLKPGGSFVFSVEHPIFTSNQTQDWFYDQAGNRAHWPVDDYQGEGVRQTTFLTEDVIKYHRTISTYINALLNADFTIKSVEESYVTEAMIENDSEMADENRRPMFLMISAKKEINLD